MASYTMPLREYIEMWSQDNEDLPTREVIEAGRPKLFDFDYPLFSSDYKKDFETKFIRQFYFTEIGFETEESFKFHLENWLNVNMPFWNNMYKSELIDFDPLTNTKLDSTANKTIDRTQNDTKDNTLHSNTSGTSNTVNDLTSETNVVAGTDTTEGVDESRFNRHLESDTPDSRLTITPNTDGSGTIEYASRITEDKDTDSRNSTKSTDTTNDSNTTDHATNDVTASSTSDGTNHETLDSTIHETDAETKSQTGKIGSQSYSQMIQEYRETFLRIEKDLFSEMRKELFMLVY
jgi:flagellin-like hook-associated protein FlgL